MNLLLSDQMIDQEARPVPEARVRVVRGLAAILGAQGELTELATRSGQIGSVDYLRYFLTGPYVGSKVPHLVLVYGAGAGAGSAGGSGPTTLRGAVLVQEYTTAGVGVGVFMTDDEVGERTVIAPAADRAWVAAKAAETLFAKGARLVLLTLQVGSGEMERVAGIAEEMGVRCAWEGLVRPMDQHLPLLGSLDATLATMGKHTRRNLRYYRRRAEEKLGCEFVPRVEMQRAEFVAVNRVCSYPVTDKIAGWRYDSATGIEGGLFVGVRGGDGRWLSLMGGRHRRQETAIAWQMNREEMASYSLSTVMRSYLLEYEVGRGTQRLFFDGGTPHSIHHAFVRAEVAYVVATRRSAAGEAVRRGARSMLPKNNFLRRVLLDAELGAIGG